jgi:hypothetical protein
VAPLRSKLITTKNRKRRRMKELYALVNARLVQQGNLRDVMVRGGCLHPPHRALGEF